MQANNPSSLNQAIDLVSEARLIIEDLDPSGAMTVGFDKETYTLTREQIITIAGALYLADCELYDLANTKT